MGYARTLKNDVSSNGAKHWRNALARETAWVSLSGLIAIQNVILTNPGSCDRPFVTLGAVHFLAPITYDDRDLNCGAWTITWPDHRRRVITWPILSNVCHSETAFSWPFLVRKALEFWNGVPFPAHIQRCFRNHLSFSSDIGPGCRNSLLLPSTFLAAWNFLAFPACLGHAW